MWEVRVVLFLKRVPSGVATDTPEFSMPPAILHAERIAEKRHAAKDMVRVCFYGKYFSPRYFRLQAKQEKNIFDTNGFHQSTFLSSGKYFIFLVDCVVDVVGRPS